ncbi:MAG: phytoene/squalene synthase family protein [Acidobacteriaceae bacterium]|nr:phytoene/squalene synthase family protein [Acidobacteriaceae bacterium]
MSASPVAVLAPVPLEESYRFCRDVARRRAKNFYYAFLLLEKPQRDAMCAIYAFMRRCDDLSDDPGAEKARLPETIALWRMQLNRALAGSVAGDPIWPAFHDTVRRYSIPHRFFHEMIDGIASDVEPRRIRTYDELYRYCYHVASVVGLTVIHIFGFESMRALLLAEKCGIAFQLTNILRDVREDALLGRVYLPLEDLDRFGVPAAQLESGKEDQAFRELMRFEAARARECYRESAALLGMIHQKSRRSLWALREIYLQLLARIEKADYTVLSRRINVPTRTKIALLLRAFLTYK